MEGETKQLKALIVVAVLLCAVIIGYNAFFVPDASSYQYFVASQLGSAVDSGTGGVKSDQTESLATGLININTASEEELDTLPGIGPVTAAAIVAYREEQGSFQSLEEVKNVNRIGEKTFEKIKDYITV